MRMDLRASLPSQCSGLIARGPMKWPLDGPSGEPLISPPYIDRRSPLPRSTLTAGKCPRSSYIADRVRGVLLFLILQS